MPCWAGMDQVHSLVVKVAPPHPAGPISMLPPGFPGWRTKSHDCRFSLAGPPIQLHLLSVELAVSTCCAGPLAEPVDTKLRPSHSMALPLKVMVSAPCEYPSYAPGY